MSEGKHTPGPWGIEQTPENNWVGPLRSSGKIGVIVCCIERADLVPPAMERQDANARLIAAAPDLLEALEKMLLESHPENGVRAMVSHETAELAKALLTRAKGEAK